MSCVAIIPARGGSRRIPRKNIKMFYGKPIIAYSIAAAKESGLFDLVVVNSDEDNIKDISLKLGADAVMSRDGYLASDECGTHEVMQYAVNGLRLADDDLVCCIYATSPLMSVSDLKRGYLILKNSPDKSHAISVGYPPLQDAAQFYWSSVMSLRMGVDYFEGDTAIVRIDSERVCDINTPEDWTRAEQMYAALQEKK